MKMKNRYFLNFESNKFNFEFLDIETGVVFLDNLSEKFELVGSAILLEHVNYSLSRIHIIKYVEKNQFLLDYYS